MSIDDALLAEVARSGNAFLRLYRWDPPTLSVGRNQSPERFAHDGVPIVRRPTGGQAVWHEHEVTYAVAAPIALFGSLREAYREIHGQLADALRTLGVNAELATPPAVKPSSRPAACFAASVGGEILVRGRKLVGSAQARRGDAFLQHGSILLGGSQSRVVAGSNETTLQEVLGRSVGFHEVADAIIATWNEFKASGRVATGPSIVASPAAG